MTKSELVAQLASRLDTSKAEARRLLEAQIEAISHHLAIGDTIVLRGLGTFTTHERPGHRGHRPSDGQAIEVAPRLQVSFRASRSLVDRVQSADVFE